MLLFVFAPHDGLAFTLQVTSDPPGAEVWASPVNEPVMHRKGTSPCEISLGEAGAPHAVLLRRQGYFDVHRYVHVGQPGLTVKLQALDDPEVWRRLPGVVWGRLGTEPSDSWWAGPGIDRYGHTAWLVRGGIPDRPLVEGLPVYVDEPVWWAPDGSALTMRGAGGLYTEEETGTTADLWWAPLSGQPVRIWSWRGEPEQSRYFIIDSFFSPDPRWVVHSAPVGMREHLRLWSRATGKSRRIAADGNASLYRPVFSPSGNLIACVRTPEDTEDSYPPSELQVMRWDGSERRTLLTDVSEDHYAAFSPDETMVGCVSWRAPDMVWVAPVAGGAPRPVLTDEHWEPLGSPMWSPGGARLAVTCEPISAHFSQDRYEALRYEPRYYRTVWVRADGSETGAIRACRLVGWFDDNTIIGAVATALPELGLRYERLCLVGLDGAVRKVLLEPEVLVHHGRASPDGSRIAMVGWHPHAPADLYLADRDGRELRNLTAGSLGEVLEVGWQEDGRVWVMSERDGQRLYHALDLQSCVAEQVEGRPRLVEAPPRLGGTIDVDGDLLYADTFGSGWRDRITWLGKIPHLAPVPVEGGGPR